MKKHSTTTLIAAMFGCIVATSSAAIADGLGGYYDFRDLTNDPAASGPDLTEDGADPLGGGEILAVYSAGLNGEALPVPEPFSTSPHRPRRTRISPAPPQVIKSLPNKKIYKL